MECKRDAPPNVQGLQLYEGCYIMGMVRGKLVIGAGNKKVEYERAYALGKAIAAGVADAKEHGLKVVYAKLGSIPLHRLK